MHHIRGVIAHSAIVVVQLTLINDAPHSESVNMIGVGGVSGMGGAMNLGSVPNTRALTYTLIAGGVST